MKKTTIIILFFLFLITRPGIALADKVIIPEIAHYGSNYYAMINVKNLSGQSMQVTATFNGDRVNTPKLIMRNSFSGSVTKTKNISPNSTWTILTIETDFWSSTTDLKLAQVEILSSNTAHPYVDNGSGSSIDGLGAGPMSVSAMFISVDSSGYPAGFTYPVFYRTRTWITSTTGVGLGITVDNWEQ